MQTHLSLLELEQLDESLPSKPEFANPLYEISQIATKKYLPNNTFTFEKIAGDTNHLFHQDHQGIILLWTPGQYLKFSVLYSDDTLFKIYGSEQDKNNDEALLMNGHRMKEFCNLTGGMCRTFFEEIGVFFGMSLPMLTAGKSQSTFSQLIPKNHCHAYWKANTENDLSLFFSIEYRLNFGKENSRMISELTQKIEKEKGSSQSDSGEIEFL